MAVITRAVALVTTDVVGRGKHASDFNFEHKPPYSLSLSSLFGLSGFLLKSVILPSIIVCPRRGSFWFKLKRLNRQKDQKNKIRISQPPTL
jgi:hypothetical protein